MGSTWSRKWVKLAAASLVHPTYVGVDWGRPPRVEAPVREAFGKDRTKIKAARKQARKSK